ncbi:uncharacterized protein G2W53_014971 [Senna tora]|uniref:Uncharacterized protein n=1 Tax=Senna tora TaxID=362788 RepID=A0A834WUP1_9FABA|nr:uncharacterized protein G2W53_014971 [Senna tora]
MWKILNRVEQEISLTYLQTKHFLFCGGGGFFSFTLPKHFSVFGKICCNKTTTSRDLMQREICPVAMDPPSMKKSIILFIHNIYTSSARPEPMENPKQSRARDFPHLPPNQTLPLPRRRRLLLLHSPEALLRFLRQDLLQRDDGAERSDATRRRRREICPVAMDPPSMVRVFAADKSV